MIQTRTCAECGDEFDDFGVRRIYATLCRGCEAVELFKLYDEGIRKIIQRGLDDRGLDIHSGFTQRVNFIALATVTRVLRSVTKSMLEEYAESRSNGIDLDGKWRVSLSLDESQEGVVAVVERVSGFI